MRPALTNNTLHNPFHNRFNDPVTRRDDDMQAYAYMVWLRERNQSSGHPQNNLDVAPSVIEDQSTQSVSESEPKDSNRIFAGWLALCLVLVVSVAVLLKAV